MFINQSRFTLRLPIQFFSADPGTGGGAEPQGSNAGNPEPGTDKGAAGNEDLFTPEQQQQITTMLQSAQDKIRNEYSKKTKSLEQTIDQLKNQGLTKEQLAQQAQEKFEQAQQTLAVKEARFYASQKLNEQKLDARLLNFVVTTEGDDEEARQADMDGKIKTLTEVINQLVAEQVQDKFKGAGYNPGNGNVGGASGAATSLIDTIRKNQIKK